MYATTVVSHWLTHNIGLGPLKRGKHMRQVLKSPLRFRLAAALSTAVEGEQPQAEHGCLAESRRQEIGIWGGREG